MMLLHGRVSSMENGGGKSRWTLKHLEWIDKQRVEASDPERLEGLIRYVARPPLSQGRLQVRGDGKIKWTLRRPPLRLGATAPAPSSSIHFVQEETRLERLAAVVPQPDTLLGPSPTPTAHNTRSLDLFSPAERQGEIHVVEVAVAVLIEWQEEQPPVARLIPHGLVYFRTFCASVAALVEFRAEMVPKARELDARINVQRRSEGSSEGPSDGEV